MPHVAVVKGIEREGQRLTVERELEGGLVELVEVSLPALLTIQTGINEPRYATLRAIKQAREKPLAVLSLADVGLDGAEVARARRARGGVGCRCRTGARGRRSSTARRPRWRRGSPRSSGIGSADGRGSW